MILNEAYLAGFFAFFSALAGVALAIFFRAASNAFSFSEQPNARACSANDKRLCFAAFVLGFRVFIEIQLSVFIG